MKTPTKLNVELLLSGKPARPVQEWLRDDSICGGCGKPSSSVAIREHDSVGFYKLRCPHCDAFVGVASVLRIRIKC